jgi:hypothetical protein
VAELDEDEYGAVVEALQDKDRAEQWANLHELQAATVEALWAILSRLDAGVVTVAANQTKAPKDRGRYPRPQWVTDDDPEGDDEGDVIVVHHVADAVHMMRKGVSHGD